jgi:hypothetical protein
MHGVLESPSFRRYFMNLISPDLLKDDGDWNYSVELEREVARVSACIKESFDMELFKDLFLEGKECP